MSIVLVFGCCSGCGAAVGGQGSWVQQGRAWHQAPSHRPRQGQPLRGHWALPGDGAEAEPWACGRESVGSWGVELGRAAPAELLGHRLRAQGAHTASRAMGRVGAVLGRGSGSCRLWCLRQGHGTFQIRKDGGGHLF